MGPFPYSLIALGYRASSGIAKSQCIPSFIAPWFSSRMIKPFHQQCISAPSFPYSIQYLNPFSTFPPLSLHKGLGGTLDEVPGLESGILIFLSSHLTSNTYYQYDPE